MKIIKALLLVLGVLVLAAGGLVGYLTLTEYRPDDIEQLEVTQAARSDNVRVGERLDVLSFNTGYWRAGPRSGFLHGWRHHGAAGERADCARQHERHPQ